MFCYVFGTFLLYLRSSDTNKDYIALIMKELDEDNDGCISPSEYRTWTKANTLDSAKTEDSPQEGTIAIAIWLIQLIPIGYVNSYELLRMAYHITFISFYMD